MEATTGPAKPAVTNPFDDEDGRFLVLADGEGRHSLWPSFAPVPAGWHTVHPEAGRAACLAHVEEHWRRP